MDGNEKMVYSQLQSFTNGYRLNKQWHVATKSVVMVGVSVDEWKRNVQNFEHVVTPAARVVEREFIVFLL